MRNLFFISYSRIEKNFLQAYVIDTLNTEALSYWYDDSMNETIENNRWWEEIVRQIEESKYFIFLFTENWQQSEICKRELATAESLKKEIIPILINDFNISPEFLYITKEIQSSFLYKKDGHKELVERLCFLKDRSKSNRLQKKDDSSQLMNFCSSVELETKNIKILGKGKPRELKKVFLKSELESISTNEIFKIKDLISSETSNKLVVTGEPGSGKSTLLQYLQLISSENNCEFIPINVSFRKLITRKTIFNDWIEDYINVHTGIKLRDFSQIKILPKLIILLDGLDEINESDYDKIISEIITFTDFFPTIKVIITSRPNGYKENDFIDFDILKILPLEDKEIRSYIEKVVPSDYIENVWNIIVSHPRINELAKIPFLLAMICTIYKDIGVRTKQRVTIFKKCILYLLRVDDWENRREKTSEKDANEFLTILKRIAIYFFKLDSNGQFSKIELKHIISLIPGYENQTEFILDTIVEKTGLLKIDRDGYHFVHRSIWEYLVAEACKDEPLQQLLDRSNSRLWEEPIRLYVGLSTESELENILSKLWDYNQTLTLRCMTEIYSFPKEILNKLYNSCNNIQKIRIVHDISTLLKKESSENIRIKILIDTISVIIQIEKDCEVLFNIIRLLEQYKHPKSKDLISHILEKSTLKQRLNKYLNDKTYFFEFTTIKSSEFSIGNDNDNSDLSEIPRHRVKINEFKVAKYLTTNKIYYDDFPYKSERLNVYSDRDCQPVNMINWYEAIIFAWWLGGDLPSSAEWEYMARSGGKDDIIFKDQNLIGDYCWFGENSNNQTHSVGTKEPNSWGIYDVMGNLREWCLDWFDEKYYIDCKNKGLVEDPKGAFTGTKKVLRGGTFDWAITHMRTTYRNFNTPDNFNHVTGFRIVYRKNILDSLLKG